ncbi:MAG: YkvA family protein [Patescibacteria group bacterium]
MTKKPDIVGLFQFMFRKDTDWKPKVGVVLALAYLLFPADVVTDIIPVLGNLDDATLLLLATGWLSYAAKKYNVNLLEGGADPPKLKK